MMENSLKTRELFEMPIRGGDLTDTADNWARKLERVALDNPAQHRLIGTIDELEVRRHLFTLSIWKDGKMISAASIDPVANLFVVVDNLWVAQEHRKQKLLSKLLIFLKIELGHKKIVLGKIHTDDTYELLKAGGLKAFRKYWEDYDGNIRDFSTDSIDEYYRDAKWKLVLENDADLSGLLRQNSFTHTYEALANAFDNHLLLA